MKIKYLGTGAAEGIPALFCECETCIRAAKMGGKDIRTRTGALINDEVLLDLTPDIYLQKLREGLDLSKLSAICVTHSHTDHFAGAELTKRSTSNYCRIRNEKPLVVYGNRKVCTLGKAALLEEFGRDEDASIQFVEVKAYQSFYIGKLKITPLPAVHDPKESCFVYLLEEGVRRILYANDSDLFLSELYRYLNGMHLDLISLDCTFGGMDVNVSGHMGLEKNKIVLKYLSDNGCLDCHTKVLATHFSHNCGMTQNELEQIFHPQGIGIAYDGLTCQWQD